MRRPIRYSWSAPFYDLISAEWPVYRAGRVAGIGGLDLRAGDRVLDIGCGTGLNFPLLRQAIGESGRIIGVDASASMLAQASHRARRNSWPNVHLIQADATTDYADQVDQVLAPQRGVDAILFTYSLSLMRPWPSAWAQALGAARPGARLAVVDLQDPTGTGRVLRSLARAAGDLGGSDLNARPWTALERDTTVTLRQGLWAGHIQVRVGTVQQT